MNRKERKSLVGKHIDDVLAIIMHAQYEATFFYTHLPKKRPPRKTVYLLMGANNRVTKTQ